MNRIVDGGVSMPLRPWEQIPVESGSARAVTNGSAVETVPTADARPAPSPDIVAAAAHERQLGLLAELRALVTVSTALDDR